MSSFAYHLHPQLGTCFLQTHWLESGSPSAESIPLVTQTWLWRLGLLKSIPLDVCVTGPFLLYF